jgi:hypothetical protein
MRGDERGRIWICVMQNENISVTLSRQLRTEFSPQ